SYARKQDYSPQIAWQRGGVTLDADGNVIPEAPADPEQARQDEALALLREIARESGAVEEGGRGIVDDMANFAKAGFELILSGGKRDYVLNLLLKALRSYVGTDDRTFRV